MFCEHGWRANPNVCSYIETIQVIIFTIILFVRVLFAAGFGVGKLAWMSTIQALLEPDNLDALLITQPENVRYLSGFTSPRDGQVILTRTQTLLLTDGRYITQVQQESTIPHEIVARRARIPANARFPQEVYADLLRGRVGVEANHLTLAQMRLLQDSCQAEWVMTENLVEGLRVRKTPREVAHIRQAAQITDQAFEHILAYLKPGVQENDIALELEYFMRRSGAEGSAFDITVASGLRSAMPHGGASEKKLEAGDLVTLDFGALVRGYRSDMTRTVALGSVKPELRAIYEAVLEAQQMALSQVAPGRSGKDLDDLARHRLDELGYGEYFAHSLGHGVGLAIHELPFMSGVSQDVLEPGMTVTIEPGVYVPGLGGVRIEDLVLVTDSGYEVLSSSPKQWTQL